MPSESESFLGINPEPTPSKEQPVEVTWRFSILTFVGMVLAAMFFILLVEDSRNVNIFIAPFFPVGLLVGLGKLMPWHKSTPLASQGAIEFLMATPYAVYMFLILFFCLIRRWRWYWVGFAVLLCLLLINVAGCHEMMKQPFHGPE